MYIYIFIYLYIYRYSYISRYIIVRLLSTSSGLFRFTPPNEAPFRSARTGKVHAPMCSEKGAKKNRSLLLQLKKMQEGRPKHVLRQEKKKRISEKQTGKCCKRASKAYRGKTSTRRPSPAALRRVIPRSFPACSDTEEDAAQWLIDNLWIPECLVYFSVLLSPKHFCNYPQIQCLDLYALAKHTA